MDHGRRSGTTKEVRKKKLTSSSSQEMIVNLPLPGVQCLPCIMKCSRRYHHSWDQTTVTESQDTSIALSGHGLSLLLPSPPLSRGGRLHLSPRPGLPGEVGEVREPRDGGGDPDQTLGASVGSDSSSRQPRPPVGGRSGLLCHRLLQCQTQKNEEPHQN